MKQSHAWQISICNDRCKPVQASACKPNTLVINAVQLGSGVKQNGDVIPPYLGYSTALAMLPLLSSNTTLPPLLLRGRLDSRSPPDWVVPTVLPVV